MRLECFKPLALLATLCVAQASVASMSLDRIIVYFEPDKLPRQDIVVSNPDQETLYLQTEVYRVDNAGMPNEELVQVTDPNEIKLLATPNKAVIPAGSRKTIRLVSLEQPKDKEAVYRVTFRPVIGEIQSEQSAIKMLIAYQALVFVRPQKPAYHLTATVNDQQISFSNSGNTNVLLRNGQYCSSAPVVKCSPISDIGRVYAGAQWQMPLPQGATKGSGYIEYGLFDGEQEKPQRFML